MSAAAAALRKAAEWFREYEQIHTRKGDTEKATRNMKRAVYCEQAAEAAEPSPADLVAQRFGHRATHTFVELEVPQEFYDLVYDRLSEAQYHHALPSEPGGPVDMHGIALVPGAADPLVMVQHLSTVRVRPGDTVVLRSPDALSLDACRRLEELVRKHLRDRPGLENVECMVLSDGLELGVLRGKKPDTTVQVLQVACPHCQAPIGVKCRLLGTKDRQEVPHKERYYAAQEAGVV